MRGNARQSSPRTTGWLRVAGIVVALLALGPAVAAGQAAAAGQTSLLGQTTQAERWMVSGQVAFGLTATDNSVNARTGELGLRFSRVVNRSWSLGLALSARHEGGYASRDKFFLDVDFERGWALNDRLRILGFAGPTAAHIDSSEEALDQGTVFGLNAGLAFEIRLGSRLLLRPEIRHRFLTSDRDGTQDGGIASVGLGIRF